MKLVGLVGSLRADSYNLKLARTIQERYAEKFDFEIADIGALPHFNQDVEQTPPQVVADFKQRIKDADGIIIVTAEYNWSVPGVLKNALDWLSRVDQVMKGKPVLVAGVTTGVVGTVRAQLHLREILAASGLSARVLPPGGNEILINFAAEKFNSEGRLSHAPTLEFLDSVVGKFVDFANA